MPDPIHLCLSDLLDQDLTSYEYYHSLPLHMQQKLAELDIRSFEQMQNYVEKKMKI